MTSNPGRNHRWKVLPGLDLTTIGASYRLATLLLRLLPTRLSQWLLYLIYAR